MVLLAVTAPTTNAEDSGFAGVQGGPPSPSIETYFSCKMKLGTISVEGPAAGNANVPFHIRLLRHGMVVDDIVDKSPSLLHSYPMIDGGHREDYLLSGKGSNGDYDIEWTEAVNLNGTATVDFRESSLAQPRPCVPRIQDFKAMSHLIADYTDL
jgi:hypothetical protein